MKEKEKTINKKKNNFFVKLKGYDKNEKNTSILKREFDYKSLKNFDIMMNNFINLILEIRKKGYGNRVPIIVIHHPEIGEIFIYSREQWDLYYKFNIIEDCINNKKILKAEYTLVFKEEMEKMSQNIIDNKKCVIKYIIKNLPLKVHLNTILNFLKERKDIAKKYEKYLLEKLINYDINKLSTSFENENNINNDNLDDNININSIIENFQEKKENENQIKFYEDYYIHYKEFIQILDKQFEVFSKYQKTFNKIKNILDEEEKIKEKEDNINNTNLNMKLDNTLRKIGIISDDNMNENINLYSVLNPPRNYVENLLNDEKYFKKLNKEEYNKGIEEYKDQLSRDLIQNLTQFT